MKGATVLLIAVLPQAAWAVAPTPPPATDARAEAKAAFNQGNAAYNLGQYDRAIVEFERAYGLSRVPEILFNLGQSYRQRWSAERKIDLLRRAIHYYNALVREGPDSKVRPDAEQFVRELEPKLVEEEARERAQLIESASGADVLRVARDFVRGGAFADADKALDRLLRSPGNGREVLAEAYLLRGRAAAGAGDLPRAEEHFRRALELRPSADLVDATGPAGAAFGAARKASADNSGLRLVQPPQAEAPAGRPARIAVTVEGDHESMVKDFELAYRRAGAGAYSTVKAGSATALEIPAAFVVAGARLDYHVRALDGAGGILAESGTAEVPFQLQIAGPPPGAGPGGPTVEAPSRWWVWALVGAGVLAGGAAVYLGTRSGGPDLPQYGLPTVR